MKKLMFAITLLLLLIACPDNPVIPDADPNQSLLETEAANIPWDIITGKIIYTNWHKIFLIDGEKDELSIINDDSLRYLSWHSSGEVFTGLRHISSSLFGYFIWQAYDLEGNIVYPDYKPVSTHSWDSDGNVAYVQFTGDFFFEGWYGDCVYINNQSFLCSDTFNKPPTITRPAWSPDSKDLIISLIGLVSDSTFSELRKYDVATKTGTTLVTSDSVGRRFYFASPIYSPDGNKIAYVKVTDRDFFGSEIQKEIWVINSDGSGKTQLTAGWADSYPAWSPSGDKLIFRRAQTNFNSLGIFIVNPDGTELEKILPEGANYPIWR